MQAFPVHTLSENDLDSVVTEAGGVRVHTDADRRTDAGADFVLGNTIIELKMLDDEGFGKPERQKKLAALFGDHEPDRPVVVLDPASLSDVDQRTYRRIIEGPVKQAATKARKQLNQSRTELPTTTGSVLWVFNNGYTALDNDTLAEVVANRVRQDTSSIEGIIVSGCYYHSDGFDSIFLWNCSYVPIRLDHVFPEFDKLQEAFMGFANKFMTSVVTDPQSDGRKLAVRDIVFDVDGVRYVRPATVLGSPSEFYVNGRPRDNSSGIEHCPPVALIVPKLDQAAFAAVTDAVTSAATVLASYPDWQRHVASAAAAATPTKPLVAIDVIPGAWLDWCRETNVEPNLKSLNGYAHMLFEESARALIETARERKATGIVLSTFVLAVTEEIGQDRANDISHIAIVREPMEGDPIIQPLAENVRMFREHAIALAVAYALAEGLDAVQWTVNKRYAWV
ncbi:MAG: hypothetical protein B7Y43_12210 [Sphingomonas sp. 28-62-20]|uniref:hypothetical protein n=1 Tax=Sphingomonas sp. 28-62-20 TaxID=1970433 RepID=UPI000BD30937|nr:MAG: hypothetical protein B7Y43_12210 [Sphingomonas sp. 28-62-20]